MSQPARRQRRAAPRDLDAIHGRPPGDAAGRAGWRSRRHVTPNRVTAVAIGCAVGSRGLLRGRPVPGRRRALPAALLRRLPGRQGGPRPGYQLDRRGHARPRRRRGWHRPGDGGAVVDPPATRRRPRAGAGRAARGDDLLQLGPGLPQEPGQRRWAWARGEPTTPGRWASPSYASGSPSADASTCRRYRGRSKRRSRCSGSRRFCFPPTGSAWDWWWACASTSWPTPSTCDGCGDWRGWPTRDERCRERHDAGGPDRDERTDDRSRNRCRSVDVVVATRNRPDLLRLALDAHLEPDVRR